MSSKVLELPPTNEDNETLTILANLEGKIIRVVNSKKENDDEVLKLEKNDEIPTIIFNTKVIIPSKDQIEMSKNEIFFQSWDEGQKRKFISVLDLSVLERT